MIDAVQAVLLVVILLLTVVLVVLGIQVFFVLREFRSTLTKVNTILDTAQHLTEEVAQPLSFMSTLLVSTKSLAALSKVFKSPKKE